jgi:hypothetical protein
MPFCSYVEHGQRNAEFVPLRVSRRVIGNQEIAAAELRIRIRGICRSPRPSPVETFLKEAPARRLFLASIRRWPIALRLFDKSDGGQRADASRRGCGHRVARGARRRPDCSYAVSAAGTSSAAVSLCFGKPPRRQKGAGAKSPRQWGSRQKRRKLSLVLIAAKHATKPRPMLASPGARSKRPRRSSRPRKLSRRARPPSASAPPT